MTVTYTARVANARFGGFYKLLILWKGSIYKLLYKEFILFTCMYFIFSMIYRFALFENQKRQFEKVAIYCNKYSDLIPMSFVLGFYVSQILKRWWNQYQSIPLPDRLMCVISGTVYGTEERGRLYRRTLMRYCSLSALLILRSVSTAVFKRFPTLTHVVDAGFMTHLERRKLEALRSTYHKYWIPCVWFCNLAVQARGEGLVKDDAAFKLLMEELNIFRGKCGMLFHYDMVSFPLVYTQVVTIAVYSFFMACLIGRQFLDPALGIADNDLDFYIPIFTLLEFFFYAGWLKVGEQLINPFGEDDDDFETNYLIDRNFQVSMLAVDEMYADLPTMEKDHYWDDAEPRAPYTVGTITQRDAPTFQGSTFDIVLDEEEMRYQHQSVIVEATEETFSDSLSQPSTPSPSTPPPPHPTFPPPRTPPPSTPPPPPLPTSSPPHSSDSSLSSSFPPPPIPTTSPPHSSDASPSSSPPRSRRDPSPPVPIPLFARIFQGMGSSAASDPDVKETPL